MSVPNQQFVDIHKTKLIPGSFISINIEEWQTAYQRLTPSGFGLYLYLASNKDGYKNWELSPTDVMRHLKISEPTYKRAKKDLQDAGYLVDLGRNHFDFYSNGIKNDTVTPVTETQNISIKNDPVVTIKQESQDIRIKNDTDKKIKNDPDVTTERSFLIRETYNSEQINNKQNSSAAVAAPLLLISYEEAATRAKKISIYDPFAKKLQKGSHPYPGKPIIYYEGEYYEPVGEILE